MRHKRMKSMTILAASLLTLCTASFAQNGQSTKFQEEQLNLTTEWDKVFPKSDKVTHSKITFHNRYGITLAADLYIPKNATGKLPAIAVSGPDVRWVGNESGLARESEWSVVPATAMDQDDISAAFEEGGFHYDDISPEEMADLGITPYEYDDMGDRVAISAAEEAIWYPAECDTSIRPGWFYHKSQDGLVKSLSKLMDIYYKSVGRNSVLLLNIPPDQRGLLHDRDVKRLTDFGNTIRDVFGNNKAAGAVRTDSEVTGEDYQMTIELDLGSEEWINRLSIGENIANGQRVEKFALEVWTGWKWKEVVRSTTIGYKRLLKFPLQKAQKVRINIVQSRYIPEISSIGLYYSSLY